ncbi:MAG TPA: YdeI/OmpD-associated family protein [Flavisolibacter sp.]|nr:YdeI/OmpD-associated family protein [Flavisolibacter sp.]
MASTPAQKLKIKEGFTLLTINAPADFKTKLGEVPERVKISSAAKNFDQVHWFVRTKAQLDEELATVLSLVRNQVACWIYYPKGSSKIQTDLTRDKGWDELLKHKDMQWISLISFDDTWSAFGMRLKTETDKKKEKLPKEREIFNYIDARKKIVYLPDDFAAALKKAKSQEAFFHSLSFTNRKEYVEWIVTAKKEETRAARVKESIERLGKEWKNPANR